MIISPVDSGAASGGPQEGGIQETGIRIPNMIREKKISPINSTIRIIIKYK